MDLEQESEGSIFVESILESWKTNTNIDTRKLFVKLISDWK